MFTHKLIRYSIFVFIFIVILTLASEGQAASLGVDVSRWQENVDWQTVSQNVSFAFVRANDQNLGVDPYFYQNQAALRAIGMPRGYYYFANGTDPIAEAEYFYQIVGPLQLGERVVLDFEINHPTPVEYSEAFMIRSEQLFGSKPLLYTNVGRIWNGDWSPIYNRGYDLWGASFDGDHSVPNHGGWPSITIKQYTETGFIPGIGTVDINIFYGDDLGAYFNMPKPQTAIPTPPVPVSETTQPQLTMVDDNIKYETEQVSLITQQNMIGFDYPSIRFLNYDLLTMMTSLLQDKN